MKITLIPSVEFVDPATLTGQIVLIIDVLRATSVITTAMENGAAEISTTVEIEEAMSYKRLGWLLGGERKARKIEGFHLSNSPLEYTRQVVEGKKIVLTTTNGTKAIHRAALGHRVFIGCMRNGRAVAKQLTDLGQDVVIVCSGTNGRFSLDDFICAGKIIYEAVAINNLELDDFAAAAYLAYRDNRPDPMSYISFASHYNYLMSLGLYADIRFCFTEDTTEVIPEYLQGKIINCRR